MTLGYCNYIVLSDVPVTGSYRHNESFQILPAPLEAPRPPAVIGAHPLIIEIAYPVSDTGRQTQEGHLVHATIVNIETAQEKLKHFLLLLTAFTNYRFFVPSNHQAWFMPLGNVEDSKRDVTPQWGQEGYFLTGHQGAINSFTTPGVSLINQVDSSTFFNAFGRHIDQVLEFPSCISQLLNIAESLADNARLALLSSCSLLDQGRTLWQTHPSLSFASCVSALEALIAFDHRDEKNDVCGTCGQERYRVMKKFQDFFAQYGSSSPEFRKYAEKVYRYRSKILHRGELFLGDTIQPRFASFDGWDDRQLHRDLIRTCRICIVNWVSAHA